MRGTPSALKAAEEIFQSEGFGVQTWGKAYRDRRVHLITKLIDKEQKRLREATKGVLHILINNDCEAANEFREAVKEAFNISPH